MSRTTVRATLKGEQLIEQYERELYDTSLSERELVRMALEIYFSRKDLNTPRKDPPVEAHDLN